MRTIKEFIKWFMYITTCILFVVALNQLISGDDTIPAYTLWQILLSGILTAGVTTFLHPDRQDEGWKGVIRIIVHYIVLCVIMIAYGCACGWVHFNLGSIVMMSISVAVVYLLVYLAGYWLDKRQADEINERLRGKYGDRE